MNIKYSYATEDDAYGINYVSAYSWKETYSGLLPDEYLNNKINNFPNKILETKEFLKSFEGKYVVAKDEDKVIGILCFSKPKKEEFLDYGHLGAIYVLKKYQGLGIGKELLRIALNGLKEMGYSKMQLECISGNKTIKFYKKYLGIIDSQIDFQINDYGTVKADVILFEDINKVLNKLK